MGCMTAYTALVDHMIKMGLFEWSGGAGVTFAAEGVRLYFEKFGLPGIMGVMAGGTTILKGRVDILAFKVFSTMAFVTGFIDGLLE